MMQLTQQIFDYQFEREGLLVGNICKKTSNQLHESVTKWNLTKKLKVYNMKSFVIWTPASHPPFIFFANLSDLIFWPFIFPRLLFLLLPMTSYVEIQMGYWSNARREVAVWLQNKTAGCTFKEKVRKMRRNGPSWMKRRETKHKLEESTNED